MRGFCLTSSLAVADSIPAGGRPRPPTRYDDGGTAHPLPQPAIGHQPSLGGTGTDLDEMLSRPAEVARLTAAAGATTHGVHVLHDQLTVAPKLGLGT
jgi:hypothetical protein